MATIERKPLPPSNSTATKIADADRAEITARANDVIDCYLSGPNLSATIEIITNGSAKGNAAQSKERPVCLIRLICAAIAVFLLLSCPTASAGDYSLSYAIDANGRNDAGKIETCEYVKACEIEPVGFGPSIFLSFMHPDHRSVNIEVYGRRRGCCYSADATRTIYLDIKPGLLRVPLYEGRERSGNEFIRNEKFGMLYLEFSNLR